MTSPNQSFPVEEPLDQYDDFILLRRRSFTSSGTHLEGRTGHDVEVRGGRGSASERAKGDDFPALNEDLNGEGSPPSCFTPRPYFHPPTFLHREALNPTAATTTPATIASHRPTRQSQAQNPVTGLQSHSHADYPPLPVNLSLNRSPSPINRPPAPVHDPERHWDVDHHPYPFSHVPRNTHSVTRAPLFYDPFDPNVIREQMALQMQIYALNNATAASVGSAFRPPSTRDPTTAARKPFIDFDPNDPNAIREEMALQMHMYALNNAATPSVGATPLTPFPTPFYNPWDFVPAMFRSLGLGSADNGSDDKLRKRERSKNLKVVQERLMNGVRSGSKLVPPRVNSTEPRDTSPEITDSSEEISSEEDLIRFEDIADKSPGHEPVQLLLPPSMDKGSNANLRKRDRPANLKVVQERLIEGVKSKKKIVSPWVDSPEPGDTNPETTDSRKEIVGDEVYEGDMGKGYSNDVNKVGKGVEAMDVMRNREARKNPQLLEFSHGSGTPAWKALINCSLDVEERISLITTILSVSDFKGTQVTKDLDRDEGQTLVDLIDETLDALIPQLRRKCLSAICTVCGHYSLLPKSVQIPLYYDRMDPPLYHGGYAEVWKGEYKGRNVAVKVLKIYQTSNLNKIQRRFCKEVMTWKTLRHQNVLPLLGVTMSDSRFAMASEWMVNGNIIDFVKARRDVNRFELLGNVVRGSIYMHGKGVVHGDLKGANILINQDGRPCIADFGLSAIASDPAFSTNLTSSATAGTIRWMSPERVNPAEFDVKDGRPTKKSDCYALGMVILEVLSGKVPFVQDDNDYMVTHKVLNGKRPERPQGAEGAWFTDDLWGTLQVCWSPQPKDRPTAETVLECLVQVSPSWEPPSGADVNCNSQISSDDESSSAVSYLSD